MNALKEGLFSRDFVIPDADRAAYDAMRADLWEQFRPRTAIQVLALDGILSSGWRYSQAILRETRLLNAEVLASDTPAAAPEPPSRWEWFGAKARRAPSARARTASQR